MKQKVINVTYRKDSETFPEWMKYEVELLNENGTTQKIPAYGKDLQDALSRVVHDMKVEKIEKKTSKLPDWVWILLWFTYMGALCFWYWQSMNQWVMVYGLTVILPVFGFLVYWSREQNVDKGS